jgi:hypothetical protein
VLSFRSAMAEVMGMDGRGGEPSSSCEPPADSVAKDVPGPWDDGSREVWDGALVAAIVSFFANRAGCAHGCRGRGGQCASPSLMSSHRPLGLRDHVLHRERGSGEFIQAGLEVVPGPEPLRRSLGFRH